MDVLVPVLGESVVEATVSKWIKKQGEFVEVDEPIVELETDKVTLEVPAAMSGILDNLAVSEGDTVEVGALLAIIVAGEKTDENSKPTPKQEKLANYISKNNPNFKIICIGASIAIASGEEKEVPNLLKNYEFLWRLRNDFFRRSKRIIETFFYYLKGRYVNKAFHKTRFIEIE